MECFYLKKYFIGSVIKCGRRLAAENIFHKLLHHLKQVGYQQFSVFYYAISELRPLVRLKPIWKSNQRFKVAFPLFEKQQYVHSVRLILAAARTSKRGTLSFEELVNIFCLAYLGKKSGAHALKYVIYREAISNRMFSYFRR